MTQESSLWGDAYIAFLEGAKVGGKIQVKGPDGSTKTVNLSLSPFARAATPVITLGSGEMLPLTDIDKGFAINLADNYVKTGAVKPSSTFVAYVGEGKNAKRFEVTFIEPKIDTSLFSANSAAKLSAGWNAIHAKPVAKQPVSAEELANDMLRGGFGSTRKKQPVQ